MFPNKPPINLLFYDASGEDIWDITKFVQYSHFVLDASAIIFLADPMQMPNIVRTLSEHLKPLQTGRLARPLTSGMGLDRVVRTFGVTTQIDKGKKIKTPIAITLSKSDLFQFAAKFALNPALHLYDRTYTNQLDTARFGAISNQVEKLIYSFDDNQLISLSKWFEDVCFFAVSTTGCSPNASGEYPRIASERCLDPLLWALWRLGVIDLKGK